MISKRWLYLAVALGVLAGAVLALSGCNGYTADEPAPPAVMEPETTPPGAPDLDDPDAAPGAGPDVVTGTPGRSESVGSWSVTVDEWEFGSGNDDVEVPPGMERLKVEVELVNTAGDDLTLLPEDWMIVAGDATFPVLPSDRGEKQGERTVSAGETENVTVNFAVPDRTSEYVLRFAPSEGGPGTLEVTME